VRRHGGTADQPVLDPTCPQDIENRAEETQDARPSATRDGRRENLLELLIDFRASLAEVPGCAAT